VTGLPRAIDGRLATAAGCAGATNRLHTQPGSPALSPLSCVSDQDPGPFGGENLP
jgi:hypothetical protein